MPSIFSRQKPDFSRLEQTKPPADIEPNEENLPEMPVVRQPVQSVPVPMMPVRQAIPQQTQITLQEKIALFEWHWARAIEIYQELKTLS